MRLRSQLLLLSLLTLSLPWAGCQTIREMEKALREGQADALRATARAVAARLGSDPESITIFESHQTSADGMPIYAHSLSAAAIVDGYDDDWRYGPYIPQVLSSDNNDLRTEITAGLYGENLFLFIQVEDDSIQYTSSSDFQSLEADHLILYTENPLPQQYRITSGAPGYITAHQLHKDSSATIEHRIKGAWQEWQKGYQLELRLPLPWLGNKLSLAIFSPNNIEQKLTMLSTHASHEKTPMPLITPQVKLTERIKIFANNNTRLTLVSNQGWILAEAGQVDNTSSVTDQSNYLMDNIYRVALRNETLPTLDHPSQRGYFHSAEVRQALSNKEKVIWYQHHNLRIGRGAIPINKQRSSNYQNKPSDLIGAVIIEQSTDTILALTNSAFNRLLIYSFLAVGLASLSLLAYASWLSLRISQFNAAARKAVDNNGKINDNFRVSNNKDELGDLSRSYGELLQRLRSYTSYLETLASKLSHELRTPLAIVCTSLDNLEHEALSAQASMYQDRAKKGAERLSSILHAMSEANRIEESIRSTELEEIPINALVSGLEKAYADIYPNHQFKLHTQLDDESVKIVGSPELLVQMLDKLVDNAVSFSECHNTIHLSLVTASKDVILTIENSGPLLPENIEKQLFDSLVSSRDRNYSEDHHLGLGLYIARLITDFHSGDIRGVNRTDGSGVVFEVRFPRFFDTTL